MHIPARSRIINRALDQLADARHRNDEVAHRRLDTLIGNLYKGMAMRYDDAGALLVTSANTPGAVYTVTALGCTCRATKPCNHQLLYDLLLEMIETDADSADMAAALDDEPHPAMAGLRRVIAETEDVMALGQRLAA